MQLFHSVPSKFTVDCASAGQLIAITVPPEPCSPPVQHCQKTARPRRARSCFCSNYRISGQNEPSCGYLSGRPNHWPDCPRDAPCQTRSTFPYAVRHIRTISFLIRFLNFHDLPEMECHIECRSYPSYLFLIRYIAVTGTAFIFSFAFTCLKSIRCFNPSPEQSLKDT